MRFIILLRACKTMDMRCPIGKVIILQVLTLFFSSCTPKLNLKAIRVARTAVESTVTTTSSGTVEASQQAVLGFSMAGRIAQIYVKLGDTVKKGQVLSELENQDLRIIGEDSEREFKRAQELFNSGLVSQAALDDAKRNFEVSRANLDKSIIKAPFEGVISELKLEVGELFQSTQAVSTKAPIRLVDLKPRIVKGDIDETDLAKVKEGAPARVKIPAVRLEPFEAEVKRVVPFVSTLKEKDRTSEIELKITENSKLIPVGASADIEVIVEHKNKVLGVPSRVLLGRGDLKYVYRFQDGKIQKTPVKTGIGNYDRTEIVSGLSENEIVIYPPDEVELKDKMSGRIEIKPWP